MSANPTAAATASNIDRANSRNAFLAGFSAWTFDAFDFFILTYVLAQVAHDFHRPISDIALTLTASLVMRPVGAFFFGLMADRYGRRIPLMFDILFYSVMEVALRACPELPHFSDSAPALRHRHGRRLGRGRVAGHGIRSRRSGAAFFPESCRKATRSAICSPPSPSGRFFRAGAGAPCFSSA